MCVTEIWTYRECGCSHERQLPCASASAVRNISEPASFDLVNITSKQDVEHSSNTTKCQNLQTTSTNVRDNSTGFGQQCCNVDQVVYKQFLESICDNCLLREAKSKTSLTSIATQGSTCVVGTPSPTILSSEVSIEIDGRQLPTSPAQWRLWPTQNEKNYYTANRSNGRLKKAVSSSASSQASNVNLKSGKFTHHPTSTKRQSLQVDNDADDEGSLRVTISSDSSNMSHTANQSPEDLRNVARKARRKAIDISREDLRVSSQWSSAERKSMEQFRDALKEAAVDKTEGTFSRFIKKGRKSPSEKLRNVKSIMTGLRKSISYTNLQGITYRPRSTSGQNSTVHNADSDLYQDEYRLTSRQMAIRDQYYAQNNPNEGTKGAIVRSRVVLRDHMNEVSSGEQATKKTDATRSPQQDTNSGESLTSSTTSSWMEHLRHDLIQRSRRKKSVSLAESNEQQARTQTYYHLQLPAFTALDVCFTTTNTSSCGSHSSQEVSTLEDTAQYDADDPQRHWRLQSPMYPSLATNGSTQSSATYPLLSERVGDVVSSGEYQDTHHNEAIDVLLAHDRKVSDELQRLSGTNMDVLRINGLPDIPERSSTSFSDRVTSYESPDY